MSAMERQGIIRVFTGEGKGKTTAALGLAWRAIGRDLKVIHGAVPQGSGHVRRAFLRHRHSLPSSP